MLVKNIRTKAEYPISKADFEAMPKGVRDGFVILDEEDVADTTQKIQAIPLGPKTPVKKQQAVEPSTGEKKSRKKKDEK